VPKELVLVQENRKAIIWLFGKWGVLYQWDHSEKSDFSLSRKVAKCWFI